ncbi:hypothetical protein O181_077014 [Austropuccinia psidii MF-1]|uniref:Uncharacterized protein n=1 Tax=Austropuccinia psidii MF-1 TaxID=1389203 RepID=A0A9Q3FDP4_9BASI|nr:hypothetical protein [Austropuccinia psidii MF-1]
MSWGFSQLLRLAAFLIFFKQITCSISDENDILELLEGEGKKLLRPTHHQVFPTSTASIELKAENGLEKPNVHDLGKLPLGQKVLKAEENHLS